MDDRRVALLVAGVALVVLGLVTATLPRGSVLGLASVTVGILLAVRAASQLIAAARARPVRSPAAIARAHQRAVPGVSLWTWSNSTSWGTTPWGVAARVLLFATLSGAFAFVPDLSVEVELPLWGEIAVRAATIFLFLAAFVVPAWVIERLTKPHRILPRSTDLAIVLPAAGVWFAAAIAMAAGAGREWAVVAAILLLVGAVAAGVLLGRRTRRWSALDLPEDDATTAAA